MKIGRKWAKLRKGNIDSHHHLVFKVLQSVIFFNLAISISSFGNISSYVPFNFLYKLNGDREITPG